MKLHVVVVLTCAQEGVKTFTPVGPTGGGVGVTTVMLVCAEDRFATALAEMKTEPGLVGGAVYVTVAPDALVLGEITPHAAPVQLGPETVHVTPRFRGSFWTVATSGKVPLMSTEPVIGEMLIDAGGVTTPPPPPLVACVIVICPTMEHFAAVVQFTVIWVFPFDTPVPLRAAMCGEPEALSEMLTVPLREPTPPGVNVVTIVQLAFTAMLAPLTQVLEIETAKSEGFTPPSDALLEKTSADVPVFVIVSVCGGLVTATVVLPKATLAGETVTAACGRAGMAARSRSPISSNSRFVIFPFQSKSLCVASRMHS